MTKRTRQTKDELDIPTLLKESDRTAEMQENTLPTDEEKHHIRTYCEKSLSCKRAEAEAKEKLKIIKPELKSLREELFENLRSENKNILQIPANLRRTIDEQKKFPPVPAYVRIVKNTKDLTITSDVVSEAFDMITEEELMENDLEGIDALVEVLINNVRRIVRSFNEQIKLTDSLPRGVRAADVEFTNNKQSDDALRLHQINTQVNITERQKRDQINEVKQELASKTPKIQQFFSRTNMTSQQVNLDGTKYNLCCRTTIVRPKVTLTNLQEFLQDGVKECFLKTFPTKKPPSKIDIVNSYIKKRSELQNLVLARIGTIGSTTKTLIHLQKIGIRKSEEQ